MKIMEREEAVGGLQRNQGARGAVLGTALEHAVRRWRDGGAHPDLANDLFAMLVALVEDVQGSHIAGTASSGEIMFDLSTGRHNISTDVGLLTDPFTGGGR